jgi:anti-sigma B factor antagonist
MADNVAYDVDLVHLDGIVVVRLAGEIDVDAAGSILTVIAPMLEGSGRQPLILDMSEVTFLDSSGISCLLRLNRAAETALTEMRIRNPSPVVSRVLDIAGLTFPTERTAPAGAEHLSDGASPSAGTDRGPESVPRVEST